MNVKASYNSLYRLVVALVCVSSGLGLATRARAEYTPPENASAPSSSTTTTGVRRGCASSTAANLTALAPQEHIGLTASSLPTFYWFVPDAEPFPMEFRLYEVGDDGERQLIRKSDMQSDSGIMSLTLSQADAELTAGQHYLWQVVLLCNPNRPSSALVTQAEVKVVADSTIIANELSKTDDLGETSSRYAKAGFWYDAFSTGEPSETDVNGTISNIQLTLLEQLADLEPDSDLLLVIDALDH